MCGLLAARVLAEHYDTVTVVERDVLPDSAVNRRGVPQGRHVHALLGRGSQVLGELFPGFLDELVAAGAPSLDYSDLSKAFTSIAGHPSIHAYGRFHRHPGPLLAEQTIAGKPRPAAGARDNERRASGGP